MIRRGRMMTLVLILACVSFGYFSMSGARGDSTPAPMTMGTMQTNQTLQNPEPSLATSTEWSVFNHRVAGFFIFLWGLTALIAGLQWPRRTWLRFVPPMALLGLVEFLCLPNDPSEWRSGLFGGWVSFQDPTVVQHRVFILILFLIAIVELLRAGDRLPPLPRVFAVPSLVVIGGIYLFFHKHGGLAAQHMMQQMSDPAIASNPTMKSLMASMILVKHEHLWFSILGFGLAAAKLLSDGGLLKGRLGATLWSLFAIAFGLYMFGYTE